MNIVHNSKLVPTSKPLWIILVLSGLNLLFMHYLILLTCHIEGLHAATKLDITMIADNLLGVTIDVCLIFLLFYFLLGRKLKVALLTCFITTWLWSFANVMYSRFFFRYITLSAIGQTSSLFDSLMIRCIIDGFEWFDIYYIISLVFYFSAMRYNICDKKPVLNILLCLAIMLGICAATWITYCSLVPERRYVSFFLQKVVHRHFSTHLFLWDPNYSNFRRGSVRTLLYEFFLVSQRDIKLSDEQHEQIANEIKKTQKTQTGMCLNDSTKNVIFILVESYMSFTSDLKINGKEVTPFLNSLKRDSMAYYNGMMHENVTIGESSDGQFIYMTGLLPLRSLITVSKALAKPQPGLPKKLSRASRMIIPTTVSVWNQDEMCQQYGFDMLFASKDYADGRTSNLSDEQLFQLAMQKDKTARQPFFSVILTMSMHQPYTRQIDPTFPIMDSSLPNDLACYLNACHYTDCQIGNYIEHLKRLGLYDSSLVIIAADHPVHNTDFGGVKKAIPLYLVNVPKDIKAKMWQGQCNQIDVYPTLLDLLGIKSDWCGLGCSLLSPAYSSHIDSKKWDVSEWIIRSDYFSM